jgi:hypothetical protein
VKTVYAELIFDEKKLSGDIQSKLKNALQGHGIDVKTVTENQSGRTDAPQETGTDKKSGIQVRSDITSSGAGGMVSPE